MPSRHSTERGSAGSNVVEVVIGTFDPALPRSDCAYSALFVLSLKLSADEAIDNSGTLLRSALCHELFTVSQRTN